MRRYKTIYCLRLFLATANFVLALFFLETVCFLAFRNWTNLTVLLSFIVLWDLQSMLKLLQGERTSQIKRRYKSILRLMAVKPLKGSPNKCLQKSKTEP